MRQIRIVQHISLDGVIAPGGRHDGSEWSNGGWTSPYRTPSGAQTVAEYYVKADLLLGRRTYDLWAGFWPTVKGGPFADSLNAATKYVATHRPESLTWGPARGLGTDVIQGVRDLKATDGPNLVLAGSSTLTSPLLEQGLVDEVVLIVYPVLLGSGKRLFSDGADPREFAFVSTRTTPTGLVSTTYRYVGAFGPAPQSGA